MQAGAGALANRVQPGQGGAPVEVDRDSTHHVVGRRGDRHRRRARLQPRLCAATRTRWESGRGRPSRRSSPTWAVPSAAIRSRIAAVTASRGASSSVKRRPDASSRVAPSPRTASVISSPSKRVPGRASAVGWNWQNSRSARSRPGRLGQDRPGADRAARVGGAPPQRRGAAGRQHGRRRGDRLRPRSAPRGSARRRSTAPSPRSARAPLSARSAATIAASFEVISCPVWLPPEWTMRRLVWPPSSPSASSPSASRSKRRRARAALRTAAGASSTSAWTAEGRQRPRPAAIVSAAWRAGESPGSSAAARPPWAQKLALWESGVRETRQTEPPRSAARSAVQSPAAPPPTTATSNSAALAIAAPPLGGRDSTWPRSQAAAASRARASPSATAASASSGAALRCLDPLLGCLGLGLDLCQAAFGGGDRLLLGLALAGKLPLVLGATLLLGLRGARRSFSRSTSKARTSAIARCSAASAASVGCRQPALGLLDPRAEALAALLALSLLAHRSLGSIYYRAGEDVTVGLDHPLGHPRGGEGGGAARRRRHGGRRPPGGGAAAALQAATSKGAQRQPSIPPRA